MKFAFGVLALCLLCTGISALKCKIGISILSKEVDCSGDWTAMKTKLQGISGNATDLDFGNMFKKAVSSATGRRRRQTDESTTAASTSAATTQDPATKYWCLSHTILGIKIKSCAPQSILGIAKALCAEDDKGAKNCACETENCNDKSSGLNLTGGKLFVVLGVAVLAFIY